MIFTHLYNDDHGHSLFGEIELKQTGTTQRISAANQDVTSWQMSRTDPGFSADFQATGVPRVLAVLSGQCNITASNGDQRRLARGDMLFAQDIKGQGHRTDFVGQEPCVILSITMPGGFK